MTKQKNLEASAAIDGSKLWDEILKAIVSVMPSQLFPLFKEVYGREYPKDTPIIVLSSETSSFLENDAAPQDQHLWIFLYWWQALITIIFNAAWSFRTIASISIKFRMSKCKPILWKKSEESISLFSFHTQFCGCARCSRQISNTN